MRRPAALALALTALLAGRVAHAQDGGIARDGGAPVLVPPSLAEAPPPLVLPEGAEALPEGASVSLLLTIDATGAVGEAAIDVPLRADVDETALVLARSLRFHAATRDGVPIPARVRFRFGASVAAPVVVDAGVPVIADAGTAPTADAGTPTAGDAGTRTAGDAGPDATIAPEEREPVFGAHAHVAQPEPGAASRVTLTGAELTTVPGTLGEPLRVVASLPGVARSPFGLGFFVVRGAAFENTGFFVDGFSVPLLYHLGAGPAVISSRLVDQLDFYPGGYPLEYGRFNAGVISLHTAVPQVRRPAFELEVDLLKASAFAVTPLPDGRGAIAVAVRRSYLELVLPLFVKGLAVSYTDYQIRADLKITDTLRANVFFFGSHDDLSNEQQIGAGTTAMQTTTALGYDFTRLIGRLEWRLPENLRLGWAGMVGTDENGTTSRSPGSPNLGVNVGATSLGERFYATWSPDEHFRTNLGVDLNALMAHLDAQVPLPPGFGEFPRPVFDPRTFVVQAKLPVLSLAAYLEQKIGVGPVEVTGGLRLDHYHYGEVSDVHLGPRVVARWHVTPDFAIKAATGLFSQPPLPFYIVPNLGDPRLAGAESWQSSAGVEINLPWHMHVESTVFYSDMSHLARGTNVLVTDPDGTTHRRFYVDDGRGRSYGLELLIRRELADGLYGWLSYTLSRSERYLDGPNPVYVPFTYDQTHVLNIALSYEIGSWRFGARFQLATGRPTSAIMGGVYDADGDEYAPRSTPYADRLPTYQELDLRIDYKFTIGDFDAGVYVDSINVYNAQNAEGYIYQYDYSRHALLPGLPFLATLGFRLAY